MVNSEIKAKKISGIIGISLWPPSRPDHNPLDYTIWGVLENKTNISSHPYIGLLKTTIEEKRNKMSKEFILTECESFGRLIHTTITENNGHIE